MTIAKSLRDDVASSARGVRPARGQRRPGVPGFLTAPVLIVVTIFYITPIVASFVLSFTNWSTYSSEIRTTGLTNVSDMLEDSRFRAGLAATIRFALFFTIVANIISIALALALEKTTRLNGIFRTLIFIPVLISPLAAGYLFRGLLDPGGPLNAGLSLVAGRTVSIEWLGSVDWSIYFVSAIQVWKSIGIFMLVYIAGLNSIPEAVLQAAKVDGASRWQTLLHIKLPMLAPALTFNVALSIIAGLQTFELIVATTQGGPGSATSVLNYLVWQTYVSGAYGYAATINLALFMLIFVIAVPAIFFLRRREMDS